MESDSKKNKKGESQKDEPSSWPTNGLQTFYSDFPELSEPHCLDFTLGAIINLISQLNRAIEFEECHLRYINNKLERKKSQFDEIQSFIDLEKQKLEFVMKSNPNNLSRHQSHQNKINRLVEKQEKLGISIERGKESNQKRMIFSLMEYVQMEGSLQAIIKWKEEIIGKLDQLKDEKENKI